MHELTCLPVRLAAATFVIVTALTACGAPAAPREVPTIVPFPGTPTAQCAQEEVLPKIQEIQPEVIRPGSDVTVSASGGYLRDNCGVYIEGSRIYKIYFDDEPVADLSCYVNHCEGKFTLAQSVTVGRHCMGVEKGSCQLEIDVVEN